MTEPLFPSNQVSICNVGDWPCQLSIAPAFNGVGVVRLRPGERWARPDSRSINEIEQLRAALSMDQPWPLPDVLAKLIEATEHLLKHHDCDAHGHEEYRAAADYGQALLLVLRGAPESRDG